jgi:prophage regulatory protein
MQETSKIIRFPALQEKLGNISRSTIDRWEASKAFPKRINLGRNSVGWLLADVDKWVADRLNSNKEHGHE